MARTSVSKSKLGTPSKPIIAYKNWLTFCSEISTLLTFIMVAIVFFTGIALAVKLAVSFDKAQIVVKELTKYVEKFIQFLEKEAAKIKKKIEETDIKAKTLEVSQKARQHINLPSVPQEAIFQGLKIINQLHFRILNPDHTLYHFHGQNWSATLVFVTSSLSGAQICY